MRNDRVRVPWILFINRVALAICFASGGCGIRGPRIGASRPSRTGVVPLQVIVRVVKTDAGVPATGTRVFVKTYQLDCADSKSDPGASRGWVGTRADQDGKSAIRVQVGRWDCVMPRTQGVHQQAEFFLSDGDIRETIRLPIMEGAFKAGSRFCVSVESVTPLRPIRCCHHANSR